MRLLIASLTFALGLSCGQAYAASAELDEEKYHWGRTLYCTGDHVLTYALSMELEMDDDKDIAFIEGGGSVNCSLLSPSEMNFVDTFGLNYGNLRTTIFDEFTHEGTTWYRWRYREVNE